VLKLNLYLKAKVREYWVVHPDYSEIDVNILDEDRYITQTYGINIPNVKENEKAEEIIPVTVLPGLKIDVKDIFN
jgi:Uma2 family endonuclease